MADYCTIAEVVSWLPNGQTLDDQTGTKPDRATVVLWIPKVTAQIDSAKDAAGETVPLTGNDATAAGVIQARELAYQIMAVRNQKEEVTDGDATFLNWHQEFLTFIGATGDPAANSTVIPFGHPVSTTEAKFNLEQAGNW